MIELTQPLRLESPIRAYDWGSRDAIAGAQERPHPTEAPEAELWIGAHPDDSSIVVTPELRRPLIDVISESPREALGEDHDGTELALLMKLLAAAQPLSLQAHPTTEQAVAGLRAERHLPAAARNYRDGNAKPELLLALTDFFALNGFREVKDATARLAALGLDLASIEETSDIFFLLLDAPPTLRAKVAEAVAKIVPFDSRDELYWVRRLQTIYPGDPLVLAPLLLHLVHLAPGEVLFTPPGVLHSYLEGFGVEVMAASDNVLRGGLTTKRIDAQGLRKILETTSTHPTLLGTSAPGPGQLRPPGAPFQLEVLRAGDAGVGGRGRAQLVLCLEGDVLLASKTGGGLRLPAGGSAFCAAACHRCHIEGDGVLYVASPQLDGK